MYHIWYIIFGEKSSWEFGKFLHEVPSLRQNQCLFWYFKPKIWFFGQPRQINFDLNFHGKLWMKIALFCLSVCCVFATVLGYIQIVWLKCILWCLFFVFIPKIIIYNKSCKVIFWQKYCCIKYDTIMGSSPTSELIETFWVVPLSFLF